VTPPGWRQCTLGELAKKTGGRIQTGPFGSQLHASDYLPRGIPVVMPVNIGDNRLVEAGIARVGPADAARLSRHRLRAGDIVYSRRGDVEKRALVREPQVDWLCGTGCLLVRLPGGEVDASYISYWLGSPEIKAWVTQHAIGATMPNLNTGILSAVPVVVPPLVEQKGIATTLGALDDKVESNRLVIAACRALAGAHYARAADGGGLSPHPLGDVVAFHNRRRVPLSMQERVAMPGKVPYYGATGVVAHVADSLFDEKLVLVGEDGSVVRQDGSPFLQYVWGASWVNNHAHVLTGSGVSTELVLLALERADVRPLVTGAAQPKLSMGNLRRLMVLLPAAESLALLEAQIAPLFDVLRKKYDENERLVALRDALLPELLSGRIRVPEAGDVVKSALT
jgi:type I restriction enzyme S subunit